MGTCARVLEGEAVVPLRRSVIHHVTWVGSREICETGDSESLVLFVLVAGVGVDSVDIGTIGTD